MAPKKSKTEMNRAWLARIKETDPERYKTMRASALARRQQQNDALRNEAFAHGAPWSPEDDQTLLSLTHTGMSAAEVGIAMGRTPHAVRDRIAKLS